MKKNKLLILSASCALGLSLVGAGVGIALSEKANTDAPSSTVFDDVLGEDAIGQKVKLGVGTETSDVTPEIETNIGVLAVDGEIAGTKDVRVYFRLNSIAGIQTASITRTVTTPEGEVVKEAKTIDVDYVYSSIRGAEEAVWLGADGAEVTDLTAAPYYLVYTLKNIPEANWFDHVKVTARLNGTEASPTGEFTYNVYGAIGDQAVNVKLTERPDIAGEYYAQCSNKGITEAVVPENYCTFNGAIATFVGKVTCVGNPSSSTGGFEGCSSLKKLTLPDTITTFNRWSFSKVSSLETLILPRDLTEIMSNSFSSLTALKTVEYRAVNLETVSDYIETAGLTVNVSGAVESLPSEKLFYVPPILVNYEGTTAEWAALQTEDNANCGLFIDNVICSDTVTHTVTFHLGEGAIDGATGEIEYTIIDGKLASSPGSPILSGMAFDGWYLDQVGETPWNPEAPVTADVDVYAIYKEFGPGISAEKPITLEVGNTYTENLVPGYERVYLTYTHPAGAEADWRYLYVDDDACEASHISETGSLEPDIKVYQGSVDDANLMASGSEDLSLANPVQEIGIDGDVRFLAEPGETYYLVADPYYNSYQDYTYYGSFALQFLDFEEDSIATAGTITYGEPVEFHNPLYTSSIHGPSPVKVYTPTTDQSVSMNITRGVWSRIDVYDVTGETPEEIANSRGSGESISILNLQANHKYAFVASFNAATTETNFVTLTLDAVPAGAGESNPLPLTIGEETTVNSLNGQNTYYSFALEQATDVAMEMTGGSSDYAKTYTIKNATTGEEVRSFTEEGESSGWGGYGDTTYGTDVLERFRLEAGSYVLSVGYNDTPNSFTTFPFTLDIVEDGDYIGRPKAVDFETGSSFDLTSRVDGFYYSFTSTTASNYLKIDLPADIENLVIELVDTDGSVIKTALTGGSLGFKVDVGSTYLLKVSGVDQDVTVTTSFVDTFEDGSARDTALTIDETGIINLDHLCGLDSANYWFKFTPSESGTYVLFSNNPSVDTQFKGVYEEGSDVALKYAGNYDDDRNEHPQTQYRFDFAVEVELKAGKTYYMQAWLATKSADAMSVGYELLTPGSTISSAVPSSFLSSAGASLTGDQAGTFYSDTAESDGYYTFPVLPEGGPTAVEIYINGTLEASLLAEREVFVEVAANDVVVAKVVGGSIQLSAVYSLTVENGDSAANAFGINLGNNDLTSYQTGSIQNGLWFKFTVEASGTYRIYSQSINGSASNGLDSDFKGIWKDPSATDSGSSLCKANYDDDNEHEATIYRRDFYVEVQLEAGVTYYMSLYIPALSSLYQLHVNIELLPAA